MSILADATQEAQRIIEQAGGLGLTVRLLGGLAIRVHSPSAGHRALVRSYPDLDFAMNERRGDRAESLLTRLGYAANKAFNLLNGDRRLLFFDSDHDRQIDVFVGRFHMCHTIPLGERLSLEPVTIPLAELLLTKLQIVQMNQKDVRDIAALLLDHPAGEGDTETVNLPRVSSLCCDDWGLWRTVLVSLDKVEEHSAGFGLEADALRTLRDRVALLRAALHDGPKSTRWKLRAKVGERILWYDLPEEVRRG
jgi:hypothetical protein